jgi:RimJ/RimL family protein N-acetyltransferase
VVTTVAYEYRVLTERAEFEELHRKITDDDLFWCLMPDLAQCDAEEFCRIYMSDGILVLVGVLESGEWGGFMSVWPYRRYDTQVAEIGLCAFREHFPIAAPLCLGALRWALENLDVKTLVGHVPDPNRHVLRMLECVGFSKKCHLDGLMWYGRLNKFVGGWIVSADEQSIKSCEA